MLLYIYLKKSLNDEASGFNGNIHCQFATENQLLKHLFKTTLFFKFFLKTVQGIVIKDTFLKSYVSLPTRINAFDVVLLFEKFEMKLSDILYFNSKYFVDIGIKLQNL